METNQINIFLKIIDALDLRLFVKWIVKMIQNAISQLLIDTWTVAIHIPINVVWKQLSQLSFIQQQIGRFIVSKLI